MATRVQTILVKMVSADNCERCPEVEKRIITASRKVGVKVSIRKIAWDTDEGVNLGVTYGLDDLPAFVIGHKGFVWGKFTDGEVEAAINKKGP